MVSTGYSERSAVAKATKKVTPTFDQYDQFYYKGGNNNPFQTWGIQSAVQINQFTKNKYAEFNTGKMGANGLNTAALNQRLVSAYLSPNRQNVLVVANFAILIDLKENAENGGDLKSVSVVEKAKTEYWNIATKQWDLDPNTKDNNKWVTAPGFKDVVPQDATEPVNKFVDNKGKLLKVPLNAQIGKPVGSTERKLFIGDTPMVEQLYGLKWKSTVLEQVVLKDQMGKVTRVTASFSWDFDPEKIKFDGNGKLDEKSNLAGLFDLGAGNPMIGGENVPVK